MNLQERVSLWHQERLPNALAEDVILKAVSEMGEVADARIAEVNRNCTGRGTNTFGDVPSEAADVVIALLALVGRYYSHRDLIAEVQAKLSVLEDRNGAHRSSLGTMERTVTGENG